MALWLTSVPALAATPIGLPGAVQPGHERPLPQAAPPPPQFDFSIQAPERSPVPRAVDAIRFNLRDIRIVGAVSLPPEQFRPLYERLLGRTVTLGDIYDVAGAIEAAYRSAGYLLVRAYVPPQHVKDGVFTIRVVEGYVASTWVKGGGDHERAQVRAYLEPLLHERPLRLATIERALLLANDIPGVSATGVLRPAPQAQGASELVVTIVQPQLSGGLAVDNRGSRFSGIWTVTGTAAVNSLFGNDQLSAAVSVSPHALEQVAEQLRYQTLIGTDGLLGSMLFAATHGQPGSTLGQLDVRTNSWAIGPQLSYPLIRSRASTLMIDAGFTVQQATINLLGTPISHDQWRVFDVGLGYNAVDSIGGNLKTVLDLAQGLPIFGATPNNSPNISDGGTTNFTKLTGTLQYLVPVIQPVSFAFAAKGQYSFKPLIEGEQILFGGTEIGRGYDPGAITGDSGIGASAELRYDTRMPQYAIEQLQPYVFFDTAKTWFRNRPAALGPSLGNYGIASVGAGLRFWFPYNIYADVELAQTLDAVPGSDNGHRATKVLTDLAVTF
jgi:hemolysin activation/secretion protein